MSSNPRVNISPLPNRNASSTHQGHQLKPLDQKAIQPQITLPNQLYHLPPPQFYGNSQTVLLNSSTSTSNKNLLSHCISYSPNPPAALGEDLINRWRVVTTAADSGRSGDFALGRQTTIERQSPHSPYRLANQTLFTSTSPSVMPYFFEDGHPPEASTPLILKQNFDLITDDEAMESAAIRGSVLRGSLSHHMPIASAAPTAPSPDIFDLGSTSPLMLLPSSHCGNGIGEKAGPIRASGSQPANEQLADMQSTNTEASSIYPSDSKKEPRRMCEHERNDEPIFTHDLEDLNTIFVEIQNSTDRGKYPIFSPLQDEVWFEESMSKEDIAEQRLAYDHQGRCMSSVLSTRAPAVALATTPDDKPVPRCRIHTRDLTQNEIEDPGCDSDCFDEYDPLDDVSEVHEALGKLNMASKIAQQLPKLDNPTRPFSKLSLNSGKESEAQHRRPYLSFESRQYLQDRVSEPLLRSMTSIAIHQSFSMEEATCIWLYVYPACPDFIVDAFSIENAVTALRQFLHSPDYSREEKRATLVSVTDAAAKNLPGRTADDISRYISDALDSNTPLSSEVKITTLEPSYSRKSSRSWSSLILARQIADERSSYNLQTTQIEVQSIGHRKSLQFLEPYRIFTEGSSDVVDCTWDSNGNHFALACTTYNDMYNRAGNLLLGNVEGDIKFLCGHKTRRPLNQGNGAILDPYLHSTVSSIDFVDGSLYSSGFDKTVKIWDVKQKQLRRSLRFAAPVLRMKMSSKLPHTGAACLQNGDVVIFRPSSDDDTDSLSSSLIFHTNEDYLEPSTVIWTKAKGRTGWVFVGYDNKGSDKRQLNAHLGDLRLFDVVNGVEIGSIRPGSTRQFDICLDESEQLLVAGALCGPAKGPTMDTFSYVRVWDMREQFRKTLEFTCRHKDINKVTIRTYVTSSGTSGKSYVWDSRKGLEPLHTLEHGDSKTPLNSDRDREETDTGVTFASWAADGSLLVTGSSDGLVKVWDPTRSDPFLYDLAAFDDPVMSGAFSPEGDSLLIGETTGKATLLSYMGRHGPPEPFVQDRSMLAPIASESEEEVSGVRRAQELLRTGQVVLNPEDGAIYGR
ncbi:hypothetical protein H072_7273 [Dactylellina haptotyla CBS 200.50]|uniref:Uncharacterized protein n=1 Tax=Dactylellina haptotyla (strain CBS 200.50) TaxID=1284197 RepID=S8A806_DACHA|nr:hypothetical protein H072_7273 [Dactylellina haptotyla CBS 200.50]